MTRDELVALPLQFVSHFTGEYEALKTLRNEEHGITMVTVTPRLGKNWGVGRKTFHLDGDNATYTTTDALLAAINRRAQVSGKGGAA